MSNLSKVLVFKILGTLLLWCVPLLLFPAALLESTGFPRQDSYMFVRMLGWAYLALCVGYYFALKASLDGKRLMGPIYVGSLVMAVRVYICCITGSSARGRRGARLFSLSPGVQSWPRP